LIDLDEIWYVDVTAMPMMMNRSTSKQEVEFQYGGRPFSETGSSNNSAADRDILSTFSTQIDFDFFKRVLH